jgi:hypothetical protein
MPHPSSIQPFTPSPHVTLHPALQAALDNLDVQIDQELIRYRRQRQYLPTRHAPARQKPSIAASEATAAALLQSRIQIPTARSSIYAESIATRSAASQAEIRQNSAPLNQPAPQPTAASTVPTLTPPADLAVSPIPSYAQQHDLSAYAPNSALQKLMQSTEHVEAQASYFASSEELLRSTEANSELEMREPNSLLNTLLTPLGIGSMLLLLLSSTTLGYVLMNPSSLGRWTQPTSSPSSPSPVGASAQKPGAPSPDLASNEFVDLNLNNLSTLPKQPVQSNTTAKPASSAAKSPASSSKKAAPESARSAPTESESSSRVATASVVPESLPPAPKPQPHLSTVVVPAKPPVKATPKPAPAPPAAVSPEPISAVPPVVAPDVMPETIDHSDAAPSAKSGSSSTSRYYVVTNYSGDASLRQARAAVPDAYVRNLPSGRAQVQLGSFDDASQAQVLQQQLQQQGIQAEIYQPK